jgi:hypothetical protein
MCYELILRSLTNCEIILNCLRWIKFIPYPENDLENCTCTKNSICENCYVIKIIDDVENGYIR